MDRRPLRITNLTLAALVAVAAPRALSSCSIVNRVDACERLAGGDVQVNQLPADDQYMTGGGQGAVTLPSGQVAVVWNSDRVRTSSNGGTVAPNAGTVRAGLLQADGRVVPSCHERNGEVQVSAAADQRTRHPVIATGAAAGSPVYVAWAQGPLDGPSRVYVRALNSQLCGLIAGYDSLFEISEDRDAMGGAEFGAFRPTVAVSRDGTRALVAYLVRRPTASGFSIKFRPVTVSMATSVSGRLEPNPVDGRDAPGLLADVALIGAPRMAALADGFVIVWPDFSEGRWLARWRFMDRLGVPGEVRTTEVGGEADGNTLPNLALALDGDDLVLAWDRVLARAPRQRDVVYQRFARDLSPRGALVTVNDARGDFNLPAVTALPRGAVAVSWDDDSRGTASTDVRARVFDRAGAPLFTGAACETGSFRVSTLAPDRRTTSALAVVGGRLVALYGDFSESAPDIFGLAVRGRVLPIVDLVPALR